MLKLTLRDGRGLSWRRVSGAPTCSQLARPGRRAAASHCTASVQMPIVLAALPPAARHRANELISARRIPASSCLGCCGERGRGAVMVVALFLPPVIRSPAVPQPRDFTAPPGPRNDRRTVRACRHGRRSVTPGTRPARRYQLLSL